MGYDRVTRWGMIISDLGKSVKRPIFRAVVVPTDPTSAGDKSRHANILDKNLLYLEIQNSSK